MLAAVARNACVRYHRTMHLSRAPCGPLRPFVRQVWFSEESGPATRAVREHVVPTGSMHVVLRLSETPLRVYDHMEDSAGRTLGTSIVGGARAAFYLRDVSRPSCSVGVMLHPGAALPVLGVPASALAERHTALTDLWGRDAHHIRERLLELQKPEARMDLFEAVLTERLRQARDVIGRWHTGNDPLTRR